MGSVLSGSKEMRSVYAALLNGNFFVGVGLVIAVVFAFEWFAGICATAAKGNNKQQSIRCFIE